MVWLGILGTVALTLAIGCDRRPAVAEAQQGAPASFTPDSVRQAQLAEFRRGTSETDELVGGAPSREELVRRFVTAVQANDTTTLLHLALSRGEFGWIYYPTNPQAGPPYDLEPGLFWFTTSQRGAIGLGKALGILGGRSLTYAGHTCDPVPSREGENTIYGPCTVRLAGAKGDTSEARLFGLIIERHGRWKFVSYANRLD